MFITAVLVFGLSQAYNLPATDYIRHESDSTGTDVVLRLVYFAFMCLVAFSETLLVDELFFHGGWRRRVLGGQNLLPDLEDDLVEGVNDDRKDAGGDTFVDDDSEKVGRESDYSFKGSFFRDYTVHVTLVFLALLAGNYFLFNAINGGFDSYYSDVGYLYTRLRSPDTDTRISAIGALTPKRLPAVTPRLMDRLENGDEKEKLWVVWGLGYRAEYALLSPAMKQEAAARILPLVAEGPEEMRATAALALARLKSYVWLDHAVEELKKPAPHPYFAVAVGFLRDNRPTTIEVLDSLLLDSDETRAMAAAWALGQMKVKEAAQPLRNKLFDMKGNVQCVAVESLGRLGDNEAVPLLVRLFEREQSGMICMEKELTFRPDGEGGDKFFLFYSGIAIYEKLGCTTDREPLRVRILKVLWRIGETRILPWIRNMAQNELLAPRERDCAIRVYNNSID